MAHQRAGGFIDRGDGKGWVLDDTPAPKPPEARPRQAPTSPISHAGGWALPTDTPVAEPETPSAPEPEPEAEENGPPPQNATKDAWVDWAVSEGFDRDEADAMTKQDLIDLSRKEA